MRNFLIKLNKIAEKNNNYIVIALAMLYLSCKLTCNPLFFRQINIHYPFFHLELKVVGSALVFPLIYILSDLIFITSNRVTTIFIIVIGIICDGLFSFGVNYVTLLPLPHAMSDAQVLNTGSINVIGTQIWQLYLHGLLATIVANIAEVLIFAKIFKMIKNFFVSTIISVFIILFFHNLITDYPMLVHQNNDVLRIIFNGLLVNMSILTMYAAIISLLMWLYKHNFFLKSATNPIMQNELRTNSN